MVAPASDSDVRCARREPDFLIRRAVVGCRLACVCAETHLTLVKLIIALLVREVKRLSCIVNLISKPMIHKGKSA
jgi:hypothetical protein